MDKLVEQISRMKSIMGLNEKIPGGLIGGVFDDLVRISGEAGMGKPVSVLGDGSAGLVFRTDRDGVLLRIEEVGDGEDVEGMGEWIMSGDDIQATGGVVKIYGIGVYKIGGIDYLVSWKEYVDEDFSGRLISKYGNKVGRELLSALNVSDVFTKSGRDTVDVLGEFEETVGLHDAILLGLPRGDLWVDNNLGMNGLGKIVAYDC